ncbi:hypothetical protein CBL_10966 [Carabus blaptoides fortunei]
MVNSAGRPLLGVAAGRQLTTRNGQEKTPAWCRGRVRTADKEKERRKDIQQKENVWKNEVGRERSTQPSLRGITAGGFLRPCGPDSAGICPAGHPLAASYVNVFYEHTDRRSTI